MKDRAQIVHQNFLRRVKDVDLPETDFITPESVGLKPTQLIEIFESQILSRQLDIQSSLF